MAEFNIKGSKIEQLSDSGNNYKIAANTGSVAMSETGDVVQARGSSKVQVNRSKEGFWVAFVKKVFSWIRSWFGGNAGSQR
jgi:hypothetical protein